MEMSIQDCIRYVTVCDTVLYRKSARSTSGSPKELFVNLSRNPLAPAAASESDAPKDTARRRRTRERLMDAAYKLFADNGVNGTSIEAIAEAAGFTRGAFYSNFESKSELFFALANREWETRLTKLRQVMDDNVLPGHGREALDWNFVAQVVTEVFSALPNDRKWALIYREFELLAMRDPEVAPEFLSNYHSFRSALAEVLEHSAARMGLRFTLDPKDVTAIVLLQYESAMMQAILSGDYDESATVNAELVRVMPELLQRLIEEVPTTD